MFLRKYPISISCSSCLLNYNLSSPLIHITFFKYSSPILRPIPSSKHYSFSTSNQIITPWEVKAQSQKGVDYEKLIKQFGCQEITHEILSKFNQITDKRSSLHPPRLHVLLRRGFFFGHRDFEKILQVYEKKNEGGGGGGGFYLYTGRGPSSAAFHVGHLIPFIFTKYLQDMFQVPLVIQLTDDEKFLWRSLSLEDTMNFGRENAKDIIALGFDKRKTFIFSNTSYLGNMYGTVLEIQRNVSCKQVRGVFGFKDSDNIGKYSFPAIQAAPSFASSFPNVLPNLSKSLKLNTTNSSSTTPNLPNCLIPSAIDQDPYFLMTRDVAYSLSYPKPSTIYSKFFPSLMGYTSKMSASSPNSAIFLSDSPKQIQKKINQAFSGGGATIEEHRKYGANLEVDVPYMYLKCLLDDDQEFEYITNKYSSGEMTTGEVKKRAIRVVSELVETHQKNRAQVTDEMVDDFMRIRSIE